MARPGTAEAEQLLNEIARKHNTDVRSLKQPARLPHMVRARREFCEIMVRHMGKPLMLVAEILKINHTTVLYHASPAMRERKRQTRTRGAASAADSDCCA